MNPQGPKNVFLLANSYTTRTYSEVKKLLHYYVGYGNELCNDGENCNNFITDVTLKNGSSLNSSRRIYRPKVYSYTTLVKVIDKWEQNQKLM